MLSEAKEYPPDFIVRYKVLRSSPILQGYRCDWKYPDEDNRMYMIWPEFLDANGQLVPEGSPVEPEGLAQMCILDDAMRQKVHRSRIQVGLKGYFHEGSQKVAEAEVIRIIGLHSNP